MTPSGDSDGRRWVLCPCCEELKPDQSPGNSCEDCGEILIGVADASMLEAWERIGQKAPERIYSTEEIAAAIDFGKTAERHL